MRKIIFNMFYILLVAVAMHGCTKTEYHTYPVKNGTMINIWQDPVYAATESDGTFKQILVKQPVPGDPDSLYAFSVKASFAQAGIATEDIPTSFSLDYSTLDSINLRRSIANRPLYEKVPDSIFSFAIKDAIISKGEYSTRDISFTISSAKIQVDHLYIVPVRLLSANTQHPVNPANSLVYFVIKGVDPFPWEILGFDSQEASGEGPTNGRAVFAIDKDVNTFWHTKWKDGEDPMPHWIAIDMRRQQVVNGLSFTNRQNVGLGGKPKTINVDVSNDGTSWTSAGSYTNLSTGDAKFDVPFSSPQTCRYFKVTVTEAYNNTKFCFYAEINKF